MDHIVTSCDNVRQRSIDSFVLRGATSHYSVTAATTTTTDAFSPPKTDPARHNEKAAKSSEKAKENMGELAKKREIKLRNW